MTDKEKLEVIMKDGVTSYCGYLIRGLEEEFEQVIIGFKRKTDGGRHPYFSGGHYQYIPKDEIKEIIKLKDIVDEVIED